MAKATQSAQITEFLRLAGVLSEFRYLRGLKELFDSPPYYGYVPYFPAPGPCYPPICWPHKLKALVAIPGYQLHICPTTHPLHTQHSHETHTCTMGMTHSNSNGPPSVFGGKAQPASWLTMKRLSGSLRSSYSRQVSE
ncbi:hypothetical protein FN846DRAFT_1021341 [Sphaerosporella brunnea]|uniref:Uncharacterized protein n=1 Tax=Sphaerosporella brunnea TaxID=1250544 RepID=A0A5J5EY91_9PEZI|nr:hypothetical protein FN846DRAFT_1021341 [Sphaerosporella brunnea]